MKRNHVMRKILIIFIWILIWHLVSLMINSKLIMAGPVQTAQALFRLLGSKSFYMTVFNSLSKILTGFFAALVSSIILAMAAHLCEYIRDFLKPLFMLVKSIPVASFIIIALLWMGSENVSVFIVWLIAAPILYSTILTGLEETDRKLLELAGINGFKPWSTFCAVYLPSMEKSFLSSSAVSLGMSFKAGIAAEVIAGTRSSIGEEIYLSKLYFSTDELFAWTAVIVLISFISEKLLLVLFKAYLRILTSKRVSLGLWHKGHCEKKGKVCIELININRSFGEKNVITDLNINLEAPCVAAITGVSGAGKTTLLNIISETYTKKHKWHMSRMFQDTRLIEEQDSVTNVLYPLYGRLGRISSKTEEEELVRKCLLKVLPEECLSQKVKTLSGGERRRVELVRALMGDSDIVLLDEPFTGLDDDSRKNAAALINEMSEGKIIIVSAHDMEILNGLKIDKECAL